MQIRVPVPTGRSTATRDVTLAYFRRGNPYLRCMVRTHQSPRKKQVENLPMGRAAGEVCQGSIDRPILCHAIILSAEGEGFTRPSAGRHLAAVQEWPIVWRAGTPERTVPSQFPCLGA